MSKQIQVVSYDPHWINIFETEKVLLEKALGDNCIEIHHIGSTSISGLAAKPIIDMIPVVKDINAVNAAGLEDLGYTCRGEVGMMFRNLCHKYGPRGDFHLHIWEQDNAEIEKHLLFREYLLNHPEDLKTYEDLKRSLADTFLDDRMAYTLGKDRFIKEIIEKSGFTGKLIVQALTESDWESYHRIKKEQVFEPKGLDYDPMSLNKEHYHFVLIQGVTSVGVAEIMITKVGLTEMKAFALDAPYQNHGLETWFLQRLERWMRQQRYL